MIGLRVVILGAAVCVLAACGGEPEGAQYAAVADTVAVVPTDSGGSAGSGAADVAGAETDDASLEAMRMRRTFLEVAETADRLNDGQADGRAVDPADAKRQLKALDQGASEGRAEQIARVRRELRELEAEASSVSGD